MSAAFLAETPSAIAPIPVVASPAYDTHALGESIAALAARIHAATYELLVMLAEFDARTGWNNGFLSCAHWLHSTPTRTARASGSRLANRTCPRRGARASARSRRSPMGPAVVTGDKIGPDTIVGTLGDGGMGAVFRVPSRETSSQRCERRRRRLARS